MEDNIFAISIEEEVQRSYLDYAMSVIVGRALPDVRDGLKPVHRRILFTMFEQGNLSNKPFKKSARIVGDVMGKYHPHGDMAIYDALVRMAQDFSMRYPLVWGQGNFGSVDGDSAAAMRYTEVKLTRLAEELLREDLEKNTVDFVPNYDGSLQEPVVLPARFPNLLINGTSGIAVGMATNIPPHNLGEVIDGVIYLLNNPDCTVEALMERIPGPDFPTGGIINGQEGIRQAYTTGRGTIKIRAKAHTEVLKGDKSQLVITEIPYQVNKANLVTQIANLVKNKTLESVQDIRDESNREGIRIVLELKRHAQPQAVLNYLYKHTSLEVSFGIQSLALLNLKPRLFSLKRMLQAFLDHRREVILRRTQYDLQKALEKAHILEGLKIALDNLDRVIKLIRASKSVPEAREGLMKTFHLTQPQAQAILDMRLQKLTSLERQKIIEEYEATLKLIEEYRSILREEGKVFKIIQDELLEIKKAYGDERRTQILKEASSFSLEDMIPEEPMVMTLTHRGYIKRTPLSIYKAQHRGGKGRLGMQLKDEDIIRHLYVASSHDYILVFTEKGRLYWLKVYEIPEVGPAARGTALVNLLHLSLDEKIADVISTSTLEKDTYLLFISQQGMVKKTGMKAYANPRKGGIQGVTIKPGDRLLSVVEVGDGDKVLLSTKNGKSILFSSRDVRAMGRVAAGVKGIALAKGDQVVEGLRVTEGRDILTVCQKGYGKRTPIEEYRLQNRGGKGIINIHITQKNGSVIGVLSVTQEDQLMAITENGKILRLRVKDIPRYHRNSQGVRLVDLEDGDALQAVALLKE